MGKLRQQTISLKFKVSDLEREAFVKLAQLEDVNFSEGLRMVIREACKKRGLWPPTNTALKVEGGKNGN